MPGPVPHNEMKEREKNRVGEEESSSTLLEVVFRIMLELSSFTTEQWTKKGEGQGSHLAGFQACRSS